MSAPHRLSRRERQIMEIVYARGSATAAEVLDGMSDPPSYSAVRAMMRILEEKGHLTHRHDGPRYVYSPVVPRTAARQSALKQLVKTFFDGSATQAVAALTKPLLGELRFASWDIASWCSSMLTFRPAQVSPRPTSQRVGRS